MDDQIPERKARQIPISLAALWEKSRQEEKCGKTVAAKSFDTAF